jgi:hypothetical protein
MLEPLGNFLGFVTTLPSDDGACQTVVCRQLLYGYIHAGGWLIWKQHNDVIFNRVPTLFQRWKRGFLEEASLQANRLNLSLHPAFISLLNLYR